MKKRVILFDMDGVLLKSNIIKRDAIFSAFKRYDISRKEFLKAFEEAKGIPRKFAIKKMFELSSGKKITEKMNKRLISDYVRELRKKEHNIKIISGVRSTLKKLKGHKMYVISGTPTKDIKEILKIKNIDHFFKGFYGSPKHKDEHIKDIIRAKKYKRKDLVYIGDGFQDYGYSKRCNIDFIGFPHNKKTKYKFLNKKLKIIKKFSELSHLID